MMQKLTTIAVAALCVTISATAQTTEQTDSLEKRLQEVVITAKQPATRIEGTTLVTSIPGSDLQNLGTAADVLGQLPLISVADEVVTVAGRGEPEIYIDGRPMRDSDELRQLQSNNIKRVELEMAPGAMYASTTKAVVRITTRRNFKEGLSVLDKGEVVARRKLSANNLLDLNYRAGAWDVFASGLIARNNKQIKGTTTNTLLYEGKKTVIGSTQRKDYPSTTGVVKAGFNYASGAQSLGGYYRYNPERGHFSNTGDEWLDDEPHIRREIFTGSKGRSHRGSVYYDNTFGGKYLLHFDGDYQNSYSTNDVETMYPDGNAEDVNSTDTRNSSFWAGKLYVTFPIAKGKLTIGTQDSYTHTTLDYMMLNTNVSGYIPSSLTDARQTSAAAFVTWGRGFGKFNLSAGVRYEYADYQLNINGEKNEDMSRRDNYVTPDIGLGYSFDDESQINVSYRMATVKPPYSHLTGSLSYVGMHEIEGGNAALRDERQHDIRFLGVWKGFMLQADYTRSIDTYAFVKRVYPSPTLQLLMQPVNIDVSAMDLYLVWTRQVKCWTPNVTLGMYKQWLELEGDRYNRPIFSYYLDNMISLPGGFLLTLNATGQMKGDMHTNRFGRTWFTMDASIGRSFMNKALQVKLSATDLFNTRNNDWTMNTCGVRVDKRQSYDHRGVSVTLTYRFHPRQSKYKGEPASETEMKRL